MRELPSTRFYFPASARARSGVVLRARACAKLRVSVRGKLLLLVSRRWRDREGEGVEGIGGVVAGLVLLREKLAASESLSAARVYLDCLE